MRSKPAVRVLLAVLIVLPQPLLPATLTVDGPGSVVAADGECSLREAIENTEANADLNADCAGLGAYGDDTIELTVDVLLDTVDNTDFGTPLGLPQIFGALDVRGNGLSIRRDTSAPTPEFGLVLVNGGDLTLRDTELSGGKLSAGAGAGINVSFGVVTVIDSAITSNAAAFGGGISLFSSTATLTHTVVSHNMATANGGGITGGQDSVLALSHSTVSGNSSMFGGGVYLSSGTLQIDHSTVSDNSATDLGGGIGNDNGTVTLTNSTLSENSTSTGGGGVSNLSGYVFLFNTTVSGNSADSVGGGIYNSATAEITNSTIVGNSDRLGGGYGYSGAGIYTRYGSSTTLFKSLLADNDPANCRANTTTDGGANLADDTTCGTIPGTLTGLDRVLADNGGPTMTHALLPGSNAIDIAGTPFSPDLHSAVGSDACSSQDQRGAGREGDCDSGAFEFLTCADLVLSGETIAGTEIRTNCKTIVVEGPDFTVTGTGDLTLRAGTSIEVGNGTMVESGGALTLVREGDLQIGNTVFVTSMGYDGDLGGPAGADAKCNDRAAAALLPGAYKAWLSSVNPASQPADTFTQSDAPYVRVDGVRIADDWDDLIDGALLAPINVNEFGDPAPVSDVWTATLTDGTGNPSVRDCLSWTSDSASFTGWRGFPNMDATWTETSSFGGCFTPIPIYCFEQ